MSIAFSNLGKPPVTKHLPFPALEDKVVKIIEEAICVAWNRLKTSCVLNLKKANEKNITKELQRELVEVLDESLVSGFVSDIFNIPTRDASVEDHTGKLIDKKPDLTFYLSSSRPLSVNKGLFFECKPIGNIATYFGQHGLKRFCDGRYAWAMPHAGMIGYVRRKKSPMTAKDAAQNEVDSGKLKVINQGADNSVTYASIWETSHERSYALSSGAAPGPIKIRHLWLDS